MLEIIVPETGLPLKFPDHRHESMLRAREFREMSKQQQHQAMFDVLSAGVAMLNASPRRRIIDQVSRRREEEWQRIQVELFAHAR